MMRHRTRWIAATAAVAVASIGSHVAQAAPAVHQESDVYEFEDMDDVGDATLKRNNSGVTMNIKTAVSGELFDFATPLEVDWQRGDATTVWFVVFNEPWNCSDDECGEDDVMAAFNGNPAKVGVHFGTGHVAGGADFNAAASLKEGDMSGVLFGYGLMDSMAAEIHLVVRSHGPAANLTGPELADALHSVDGGCDTNTCGDPQFAVFLAP